MQSGSVKRHFIFFENGVSVPKERKDMGIFSISYAKVGLPLTISFIFQKYWKRK